MSHLKSFTLLALVVLLLAGPTIAQTVNLQLMNEAPGNQIGGEYTYPYNFSINGSASYTPLLCDTYNRTTSNGESWTANVYPLTSPLTAFGQSSQIPGYTPAQTYQAAAIIFSEILNNTVPGANGNAALASAYGNLAIWAMFDGGSGNGGYDSAIETPIIMNALNSTGLYGSSFYSQFSVYTPTDLAQDGPQEFIGYTPAGPGSASIVFLGGGSSSLFLELGQAAVNLSGSSGPACIWTQGASSSIVARDNRTSSPTDEQGNIWVVWGPGTGTCAAPTGDFPVFSYMSLDSVVADRCFFEADSSGTPGCVQVMTIAPNTIGANLLPVGDTTGGIPSSVISALNGQHFFVAGTDIRPEDAKFAIQRALAPCNAYMPRQFFNNDSYYLFGLGYQTGNPNVGTQILGNAGYGGGSFNVLNFNITGTDPITSQPVPGFSVSTVGAQPIIVAMAPVDDGNVAAMTDITASTLDMFYTGILGRTDDLLGTPGPAAPVMTLVREPLSGSYNTFEYSIPQSTQFHAGQDYGNCGADGTVASNPMAMPNGGGVFGYDSQRVRVIGTDNMIASLQAACPGAPRLGYFFWSAANAKSLTSVKYLKVNGVDPILDSVTEYNGVLPGTGVVGDPGLAHVGFAALNAGDYPLWSALRLVGPPGNAGVAAMMSALSTLDATQKDYIPASSMKIWHSHFYINGEASAIPFPANGPRVGTTTLCAGGAPESGGDVGASTLLITNNANFCSDYGSTQGKLNLTQ